MVVQIKRSNPWSIRPIEVGNLSKGISSLNSMQKDLCNFDNYLLTISNYLTCRYRVMLPYNELEAINKVKQTFDNTSEVFACNDPSLEIETRENETKQNRQIQELSVLPVVGLIGLLLN